jgi:hypothetical protein
MGRRVLSVAVEGITDVPIVEKIIVAVGLERGPIYGQKGKDWLDRQIRGYNHAALHADWLVLRDLDHDADCGPQFIESLGFSLSSRMHFRIAVRASEAWLLADREEMSGFLDVPLDLVPRSPEDLDDPKLYLVNLARRSSSGEVRDDLVPESGSSAPVGPAYTVRMAEFILRRWRPAVAARRCDSLRRCLDSLRRLASR